MTEFLSSDPNEFDKQLHDHFGGVGKSRTVLSGTWRMWMNEEGEGNKWECLAAWDNDDGFICFTMQEPDGASGVHAVRKEDISRVHAVRTFAALDYLYKNPRKILLMSGFEAPYGFATPNLYQELLCLGFSGDALIAEYEALGGEYD